MNDSPGLQSYQQGWLDGAAMKQLPRATGNCPHYLKGYEAGSAAWQKAMDDARIFYDEPLTSELDGAE